MAKRTDLTTEQLAKDVLRLADVAGMPDSFWQTDSRVERARAVLGLGKDDRYTKAHIWDGSDGS